MTRAARRGLFLAVEGPDGAGKTTQINLLAQFLAEAGVSPVVSREPGGTPVGQAIRDLLLDPAHAGMVPQAEALLYAADRAQHVHEVIRPALEAGGVVVSDRYLDSSLAYQGLARGLGVARILEISTWATGGLLPDLAVLLDTSAELARTRSAGTDRLEQESAAFHRRVAEAYWALARTYAYRFAIVDGTRPPAQVAAEIRRRVEPLLARVTSAPASPGAPSAPAATR